MAEVGEPSVLLLQVRSRLLYRTFRACFCPSLKHSRLRGRFLWNGPERPVIGPGTVAMRGAKLVLVGLLMVSIGLHWTLLQSVAWAGMLVRYSQEGCSLSTAIAKTLDGQHPCQLCKITESGRRSAASPEAPAPVQKLDLFAQDRPVAWSPERCVSSIWPVTSSAASGLAARPPVPPPRAA